MTDDNQYLQMFFDEAEEYIESLNENILELEKHPGDDAVVEEIFRAAHSMKGMAASMGFETLTELTHVMENGLDKVRNDEIEIDTDFIDLLFEGIDYINELVDQIKREGNDDSNLDEYINRLNKQLEEEQTVSEETEEESSKDTQFGLSLTKDDKKNLQKELTEDDALFNILIDVDESSPFKEVRGYMALKKANEFGRVIKSEPEMEKIKEKEIEIEKVELILVSESEKEEIREALDGITDIETKLKEIDKSEIMDEQKKAKDKSSKGKSSSQNKNAYNISPTVRVKINKLDRLMNMVGELLINKTRLASLDVKKEGYTEIISQLDRVTMDLHHTVMQIRMVPIGGMFNRFPRMVRDISKEMGKEVDLKVTGEDTELDRSIIDELSDPLTHLLRNAVDHGIEEPSIREEKGKDRAGTINLRAYQKGSEIIIEVEDDGSGIDIEALTQKAVNEGLVTEEDLEEMDRREKLDLIFHPGFSTTEEVSDVSGRGVGMDVVKKTVEKELEGQVFIETEKGEGTKFTISLPLTLAITEALMVRIGKETFALPLNNVSETLKIQTDEVKQVKGQDVIIRHDNTIPLIDSRESLNMDQLQERTISEQEEISIVIINTGDREIGFIVDELLNQQEIVIKSISDYLETEEISGATIVGDGEIALILDVRNIA